MEFNELCECPRHLGGPPLPFFFIRSHDVVCEGQNKKEDFKSLVDLFFWGRMVVTEVDRVGDPLTKKKIKEKEEATLWTCFG